MPSKTFLLEEAEFGTLRLEGPGALLDNQVTVTFEGEKVGFFSQLSGNTRPITLPGGHMLVITRTWNSLDIYLNGDKINSSGSTAAFDPGAEAMRKAGNVILGLGVFALIVGLLIVGVGTPAGGEFVVGALMTMGLGYGTRRNVRAAAYVLIALHVLQILGAPSVITVLISGAIIFMLVRALRAGNAFAKFSQPTASAFEPIS